MEPVYLIRIVREALAQEEGELAVRVEILRNDILLRGIVPSEARRTRLASVVRRVCGSSEAGGYRVVNEIRVRVPGTPATPEELP
jgi:hypothetical protein